MNILITTGIYPPELGGPAEYAKNLSDMWRGQGHTVRVKVFSRWNKFPTGIRHILYFFAILPAAFRADYILTLDTFSAALPTVIAAKICGVPTVLRTGGDFLWEQYVERTGRLVLLRDFYKTEMSNFSTKERRIFSLIRFILRQVDTVVWSTQWQKNIFLAPYGLGQGRHVIIENYYGERLAFTEPTKKNFVAATRPLKWKNMELLKEIFAEDRVRNSGALLDTTPAAHAAFLEKVRTAYAVIIASLGDISPNTILDAIRAGTPFIVTEETGLYDRIKDIALFVNPKNREDIAEKILYLADDAHYAEQKKKVENFPFVHTWQDIATEFMDVFQSL